MRITVIGCGYVGKFAALAWKELGHDIQIVTRSLERKVALSKDFDSVVHHPLYTGETLKETLADQDAIIITVAPDTHSSYTNTYLTTTLAVQNSIRNLKKFPHVLYTSSTSVYAEQRGNWVDEDSTQLSQSSTAKVLIDAECQIASIPHSSIFRLGEIYGPGRSLIERLKRLNGKALPGDGNSLTNLIHVEDIFRGMHHALTHQLEGLYNLCNDTHLPRKELYEQICLKYELDRVQWDPTQVNFHGSQKKVCNAKIKQTGFVFSYPFFVI